MIFIWQIKNMKKKLTFILLLLSISAFSQFEIGAKIGLSTPTYYGGRDLGSDTKVVPNIGFTGGLVGVYNFKKSLAIQGELLFTQGGFRWITNSNISRDKYLYETSVTINYLQIPVLLRINKNLNKIRLSGYVGPYIGITTGGKLITNAYKNNIPTYKTDYELKVQKNDLAPIDLGGLIGYSIGIKLGKGYLYGETRVMIGLLDINDVDKSYYPSYKPYKNIIPTFNLGYIIIIGN